MGATNAISTLSEGNRRALILLPFLCVGVLLLAWLLSWFGQPFYGWVLPLGYLIEAFVLFPYHAYLIAKTRRQHRPIVVKALWWTNLIINLLLALFVLWMLVEVGPEL